jgi:hypothetical protein
VIAAARGLAVGLAVLALLAGPGSSPVRAEARAERVVARDGRVTVKVEAMRADRVLGEIARLTGIRISASPAVLETLVTADIADVEIEAALPRLLPGCDHVLVFGPAADGGLRARPVLQEVQLFPAPARITGPPAGSPRTAATNVAVLLEGLHDADPAVRVASIEALGRSGPEVPVDRVLAAGLGDFDPRGRLAILTSGLTIPLEILFDRAQHDASPVVRAEALTQLPRNDPRVEAVAQTALADQDDTVRDVARNVLAALQARQAGR